MITFSCKKIFEYEDREKKSFLEVMRERRFKDIVTLYWYLLDDRPVFAEYIDGLDKEPHRFFEVIQEITKAVNDLQASPPEPQA